MVDPMMHFRFPGQGRKRKWTEEDGEEFDDSDDDPQFICGPIVDPEVWKKYKKEIKESESFDIPFYPGLFHHSVVPYKNFLSDPDKKQKYRDMCTTAIQKFNSENRKNYVLDDVVDVNISFAGGIFYYMTFEATDRDKANAPKTFQAQVWHPVGGPIEIDFCRFKTYLRYREELSKNAAYLGTPGKGILAADESTGTIGKRLLSVNVENVESNRRALCELLFCTPGALQYLSGVILFEETLYQKTAGGNPFFDVLTEGGVLPGIKVDKGTVELPGTNGETTTQGLDGLAERCSKYYEAGARFASWRAVLKIGLNEPSELAINENANGLARFAIICQRNGLVPIIEPGILVDGPHDINKCADVTERVLASCYKALNDQHVLLQGTLLKLNMVTPGSESAKVAPEVVAEYTVRVLQRTVPLGVPAVVFLSGGQSEEEATINLNAMNKLQKKKPWSLSFSFGSALQQSTLYAWAGKEENVQKAQAAFLTRCRANSEATLGKYAGAANLSEGASKNLHVKDSND